MSKAKRTDPELWENVKEELKASDKGGDRGEWSARKAQLAVQEYKKRGGGYEGGKPKDNSLKQWTEEEWGTKSGRRSKDTGERYLPKKAREELSDEEYRRTTQKKRADTARGKQHSSQPQDVKEKTAKHRDRGQGRSGSGGEEPSKRELIEAAQVLGVEGRSSKNKAELRRAIADAVGEGGADDLSKDDLEKLARTFDVEGRSKMSRDKLHEAVRQAAS